MQIQKAVPVIDGLLTFITVVLGVLVFVYVLFILADIYRRDPNDFDKINYAPPPGVDKVVIDPQTGKASTVTSGLINPATGKKYDPTTDAARRRNVVLSYGQDACFGDQKYDYYSGKCIPTCSGNKLRNMVDNALYNNGNINLGLNYNNINAITGDNYCVTSCPATTKVCGKFCIPTGYSCGAESFTNLGDTISPNSANEFSNYSRV